ncbi:hypothetical protein AVEN_195664-1 [Araneus ventricosus]|uniref:Uncharacterized protein n=1 Tax=Araneus ventricosus TaxID=182803 RepID=A0A4Y2B8Y5_ARAVE|nr:hypothetical protein AVEN_195664-1 [Araneus ventricosus]
MGLEFVPASTGEMGPGLAYETLESQFRFLQMMHSSLSRSSGSKHSSASNAFKWNLDLEHRATLSRSATVMEFAPRAKDCRFLVWDLSSYRLVPYLLHSENFLEFLFYKTLFPTDLLKALHPLG